MFLQVSVCPQGGWCMVPGGGGGSAWSQGGCMVLGEGCVPGPGGGAWCCRGRGVCLVLWGGGGLLPHPRGVCVWSRGVCAWSWGGVGIPACTEAATLPGRDGYCCGRYASYWNAFLFDLLYKLLIGWQTSRHLCYGPIY